MKLVMSDDVCVHASFEVMHVSSSAGLTSPGIRGYLLISSVGRVEVLRGCHIRLFDMYMYPWLLSSFLAVRRRLNPFV